MVIGWRTSTFTSLMNALPVRPMTQKQGVRVFDKERAHPRLPLYSICHPRLLHRLLNPQQAVQVTQRRERRHMCKGHRRPRTAAARVALSPDLRHMRVLSGLLRETSDILARLATARWHY